MAAPKTPPPAKALSDETLKLIKAIATANGHPDPDVYAEAVEAAYEAVEEQTDV